MDKIRVVLREPTLNGRLYYQRDSEVEDSIIYVHNPNLRKKAYSILVSYDIILFIDPALVLYFVDFKIPKQKWTLSSIAPPTISKMADIGFENSDKREVHVELPISTETDPSYSYVFFTFDQPISQQANWVGLSEQCAALIDGEFHKGFFVDRRPVNNVASSPASG